MHAAGSSSDSQFGYAKGMISVSNDGKRGFWLTHSIPGYPSLQDTQLDHFYSAPLTHGHSMMCVSLSGDSVNTLAKTLQLNKPKVRAEPGSQALCTLRLYVCTSVCLSVCRLCMCATLKALSCFEGLSIPLTPLVIVCLCMGVSVYLCVCVCL